MRTAKAYILYRAERTRARDMNTRLMKIYEDITYKPAKDSDIKRENANINGDTAMGTMLQATAPRAPSSSTTCSSSSPSTRRPTARATSTSTTWTF